MPVEEERSWFGEWYPSGFDRPDQSHSGFPPVHAVFSLSESSIRPPIFGLRGLGVIPGPVDDMAVGPWWVARETWMFSVVGLLEGSSTCALP